MTAITFVALGTSLPDLFASKQAAQSEKTADNSIGNVTGSNSVNVFLGLGLPWTIAAIYWTIKVSSFHMPFEYETGLGLFEISHLYTHHVFKIINSMFFCRMTRSKWKQDPLPLVLSFTLLQLFYVLPS